MPKMEFTKKKKAVASGDALLKNQEISIQP